jgi:hypothetical protein
MKYTIKILQVTFFYTMLHSLLEGRKAEDNRSTNSISEDAIVIQVKQESGRGRGDESRKQFKRKTYLQIFLL